ncbi:MAG: sugar ABC transporter substrate-binding protein [Actinobacteria bacterium]|nr:sugar ABC transporter substrate-binding protein [Actinomycetota bacterium]
MQRRLIPSLLALGVVAATVLVGCGSSSGGGSSTVAPTTSSVPAPTTSGGGDPTDPAIIMGQENIDKILASYTGENSTLPNSFGTATPKPLKIGWSEALDANELNNRLSYAIQKAVEKIGGTLITLDAGGDPANQVTQIQQLINQKVDGIIVWPLDATALVPVLTQAKAAGIPITAMEVTPNGSTDLGPVDGQVIYGRDLGAYVSAKLMSELHPGAQVATNKFSVPVPSIVYYAERASYWAGEFGLKVLGTFDNPSDNVAGGEQMAGPVISANPEIKGWLAYNDASALGVTAAARTASKTVSSFGINGEDATIPAIEAGQIELTIQPPAAQWAEQLVNGILLVKAGQTIPKSIFVGLGNVITKQTVANAKPIKDIVDAYFGG